MGKAIRGLGQLGQVYSFDHTGLQNLLVDIENLYQANNTAYLSEESRNLFRTASQALMFQYPPDGSAPPYAQIISRALDYFNQAKASLLQTPGTTQTPLVLPGGWVVSSQEQYLQLLPQYTERAATAAGATATGAQVARAIVETAIKAGATAQAAGETAAAAIRTAGATAQAAATKVAAPPPPTPPSPPAPPLTAPSWFSQSTNILGVEIPNMVLAGGGGLLLFSLFARGK